jgi:hypothetical protein
MATTDPVLETTPPGSFPDAGGATAADADRVLSRRA